METIISALISAGATLLVCLYTQSKAKQKEIQEQKAREEKWKAEEEKTRSLMEYKIDDLSKKVEKHNNLIERTFDLERRADVQEEKMKVANHRIENLEKSEENS